MLGSFSRRVSVSSPSFPCDPPPFCVLASWRLCVNSEHTCSTFLLPFTLYRWTESVTCTGSSLFAVGYAYSERRREYSALLPFRLRQTDLNPHQECQNSENRQRQGRPKEGAADLFSAPFASPSRTPSGSPTVAIWSPLSQKRQKQLYILCSRKDG